MRLEVDAIMTPAVLARGFCELDDEAQADFFIEVARIAATWSTGMPKGYQFWLVGRHLRNCDCATEEAREVVRELASGLEAE